MSHSKFKIQNWLFLCLLLFVFCFFVKAQSTNQNFPTPVTSGEINGAIKARDVGDARLTTYFYAFNGTQGDIFINVVTNNLDGDFDIFTAEGLRPLTKIRVYSDNPDSETGRVIYLRQPQKLILRVEGRTPTDDPATFRIKFAGSFQALAGSPESDESKLPEVAAKEESDIRVNSVGTIIEVKPKPTPTPKESTAKVEREETRQTDEVRTTEKTEKTKPETAKKEEKRSSKRQSEVKTEDETVAAETDKPKKEEETAEVDSTKPKKQSSPKKPRTTAISEPKPKTAPERKAEVAPVDPAELANVNLVVDFKDGRKIERPLNDILRFGVDKGILTIIAKDGSIGRYSMLDVAKITIQ